MNPQTLSIQKALLAMGFDPGPLDGKYGDKTRKAMDAFQSRNGMPVIGPTSPASVITSPPQGVIRQGSAGYLVNEVILHCAAVDGDWHIGKTAEQVKAEIDIWHRARGFSGFGYHGLFMPDGTFLQGRPYTQIGAHVVERNSGTIGYLMIESAKITRMGQFEDFFTDLQRKAVRAKIATLTGIKWVTGHNDYASKLCPGFKVQDADWL